MRKITKEDFLQLAADNLLNFQLIGEYNGWNVKTKFKHIKCDFIFETTPQSVASRLKSCPKCFAQVVSDAQKMTLEDAQNVLNKQLPDYEIIPESFQSVQEFATFRHKTCGNTFVAIPTVLWNSYVHGDNCPKCRINKQAIPYKKVKEMIEADEDYSLISQDYQNISTPLTILHKKCGRTFQMDLAHYSRGQRCSHCRKNRPISDEELVDFFQMHGYTLLSSDKKIHGIGCIFKHNSCGEIITSTYDLCRRTNSENWCKKCFRQRRMHEINIKYQLQFQQSEIVSKFDFIEAAFERDIYNIENDKHYRVLVKLKCKTCGAEEWVRPENFNYINEKNYAHRCHSCVYQPTDRSFKVSGGEARCREVLSKLNIKYIAEYSFEDLYNPATKHCLRYDFAIFKDTTLLGLIEYDGEQHTQIVEAWGGEEGLLARQHWDNVKNNYCSQHNIPLLRISYVDYNIIESIIKRWIKEIEKKEPH